MKSPIKEKRLNTLFSYFMLAVAVIISYKVIMNITEVIGFIKWFLSVISPFIMGFLLAYILSIPREGIRKIMKKSKNKFIRDKNKLISVISVYILVGFIVYLILNLIVPSIAESISFLATNFSNYYGKAIEFLEYLNGLDILELDIDTDKAMDILQKFGILDFVKEINVQDFFSSFGALSNVSDRIINVSSGILNAFLMLISSFYILLGKEDYKKYLDRLIKAITSDSLYQTLSKYTSNLNKNFKQYIYTQTIDGCILGFVVAIELYLLKSPHALLFGILMAIGNYIPYFGSIFGTIFIVIIVGLTQGFTTAVIATAVLFITQQIDANILQPRLMSGSFSLSPLLVIISITIGGAISKILGTGILGMIVAIPVAAMLKDIVEEVIVFRETQKAGEKQSVKQTQHSNENQEVNENQKINEIQEINEKPKTSEKTKTKRKKKK